MPGMRSTDQGYPAGSAIHFLLRSLPKTLSLEGLLQPAVLQFQDKLRAVLHMSFNAQFDQDGA